MSHSVSLNVKLNSNAIRSCKEIIILLLRFGWNIEKNSKITFLPLNDDDMFDWTSSNITFDDFIKLVEKKENAKEIVGVELYWQSTDIGGHLLMYNNSDFSFEFNINTKYVEEMIKIPDFNWYAEKTIPCLNQGGRMMEYKFEFTY
ncbi:hypothetical protein [Lacrimispora brassicae]